jgi:hypothetical protein
MEPVVFQKRLLLKSRGTKELKGDQRDPGPVPVTKVSGVPWWPRGRKRPHCRAGHPMSFVLQAWGPDISESWEGRTLVSFHYCQQCAYEGRMSWGWGFGRSDGYDVSIFDIDSAEPDGLGLIAEPICEASFGTLPRRQEVPLPGDAGMRWRDPPEDYPSQANDLDENLYDGLIHIPRSKVGGWPSWVQDPSWPLGGKWRWQFVGQIDSRTGRDASWAAGGYAYLFCRRSLTGRWHGELTIQTT